MADRDEAVLAARLLEANKALAEAIQDEKKLARMADAERADERQHEQLAERALLSGDEHSARSALQAKRARAKDRARHEQLVARQRKVVARFRGTARSLSEQLAELRAAKPGAIRQDARGFRHAAWLKLMGTLPERAAAKANAPLATDEHDLRDQLVEWLRLSAALEAARDALRLETKQHQRRLEEAEAETERWKKRAALAMRAGDDEATKALLRQHLSRSREVTSHARALDDVRERVAQHDVASKALEDALAEARRSVPHLLAALSQ